MSSSQYNTCSALQRSSQGVQPWNPEQTPLTHRVGQLDTIQSEKETHDPCAHFPIPGGVLGPVSIGLLCLSACSVCPGVSVVV